MTTNRYLPRQLPDDPYWGVFDTRTAHFVVGQEHGIEAWARAAADRLNAGYQRYIEDRAAGPDALAVAATEMVTAETKTEPLWVALLVMAGAVVAGAGFAALAELFQGLI